MDAEPSIECGSPEHRVLVPWATFSIITYALGIPIIFAYITWKHRDAIRIDQDLRARGEGHTRETNPSIDIRRRYRRIYHNFTAERFYWGMVVFVRKFTLAFTTLMFNRNPSFQASLALGILFTAYALQTRYRPYLARSAVPLVSLAQAYDARNRKKTMVDGAFSMLDRSSRYVFDYNRMETILLTSSIFVLLSGLIFASSKFEEDSVSYLLAVWIVVIVIVCSTIYTMFTVLLELYRSYKYTHDTKVLKKMEVEFKEINKQMTENIQMTSSNYVPSHSSPPLSTRSVCSQDDSFLLEKPQEESPTALERSKSVESSLSRTTSFIDRFKKRTTSHGSKMRNREKSHNSNTASKRCDAAAVTFNPMLSQASVSTNDLIPITFPGPPESLQAATLYQGVVIVDPVLIISGEDDSGHTAISAGELIRRLALIEHQLNQVDISRRESDNFDNSLRSSGLSVVMESDEYAHRRTRLSSAPPPPTFLEDKEQEDA